jgi:UDP-N-acetylglucosamine--N-acetylmuramyl-(pentapeptide) pyrophosphoryl-undecaprenol N-acetylglucosamine transferase
MRLPCLLVPYPIAADNHQFYNARALAEAGAALLLEQAGATGEKLATHVLGLLLDEAAQSTMKEALARWHHPDAATLIAEKILARAQPTSQSQLNEAQSHASDDSTLRHSQSSSVSCDLKSQP